MDTGPRELGHVQIPPEALIPAEENGGLYRPVDPGSPDIHRLAEGMRKHGVLVRLVVTRDGVVLSGHRRREAALLAGLPTVPCTVMDMAHDDPLFLPLLREYNRQRVKGIDEVVREEIVSTDPEEAYRLLVEHRKRESEVSAEPMVVEGRTCRARISKAKHPLMAAIKRVVEELRQFWPLSDRQVHYSLLNEPPLRHAGKPESTYANDKSSYRALTDILTRMRLKGLLPFRAIADPTRPFTKWRVYDNPADFVREELEGLLRDYGRNLMGSQGKYIEVLGEKLTLQGTIEPVLADYCVPFTIGRGYCSLEPRYNLTQRFRASGKERLVLLILSDLDPDGEEIAQSFVRSLRDDFGVEEVHAVKVALTAEQIEEFDLPPRMEAKRTSANHAKFVARHGRYAFELEALPPEVLQGVLRRTLDQVIDVKRFNDEIDREKQDAAELEAYRRRLLRLAGELPKPGE